MELEYLQGFSFKQSLANMGKIFIKKDGTFQAEEEGKLKWLMRDEISKR